MNFKPSSKPKIGFLTTWNTKCGIASYVSNLVDYIEDETYILAPKDSSLIHEDRSNVFRCWEINQSFNQQMGYVEKDNVKLLGEDKMVQYYWDWLQNALLRDKPWDLHPTTYITNNVHQDIKMLYPPENTELSDKNKRDINKQLILRALIPIALLIFLI